MILTSSKLLLLSGLQTIVALVFLRGFLLTRVELPDVAECQSHSCNSQLPQYQKAVVLIVDAVRYDFLCGKQDEHGQLSRSLMPRTLQLVQAGAGAAVASRFVADTPTITMSRLKALLTGGLPTFLDIGQSFSASAITEDNLLQQLLARNKSLVMLGDDTWMQLAQHAFTEAHPYPSFNVHDLHTVDDGVWEHLLPLLKRPETWDVLIAHYLGVDHAGHTYGVNSRQMEDKLAQMDDQVSTVIESLVAQAGPGGVYEDTLLVVLSDHGQTQGGDHGGGTPDETDSILIAISLRHMNATLQEQQQQAAGSRTSGQDRAASTTQTAELLLRLLNSSNYADSTVSAELEPRSASRASDPTAALSELMVCRNTVPQIDITPLLAHSLGVPIPFGNLGKLPPHLFVTLATAQGCSTATAAWLPAYSAALAVNAAQVHEYLNRYAVVGGLPAGQLATVNQLYTALQDKQDGLQHAIGNPSAGRAEAQQGQHASQADSGSGADVLQLEALVAVQLRYLDAAADLARRRFTLFQQGPIWVGCALGILVLGAQLWYIGRLVSRSTGASKHASPWDRVSANAFACLAAFHALGLFSVGLLMGEGRLTCVLMAAVTLILLRAAMVAVLHARKTAQTVTAAQQQEQAQPPNGASHNAQASQGQRVRLVLPAAQVWDSWEPSSQAVRAAVSMLTCNMSLQLLGLIDRSGADPHDKAQPTSELLVGPDAAWQRSALLAFTVGCLIFLWVILHAADRLLSTQCMGSAHAQQGGEQLERGDSSTWGQHVVWCLRTLCASQFVCLAYFWAAQLFGHSNATLNGVGAQVWSAVLQSRLSGPAHTLSGLLTAAMQQFSVPFVVSEVYDLPLRLLLPRLVYAPALVVLAAAALAAALPRARHAGKGSMNVAATPLLLLWLCAVLAAPLIMVLGFKGPATMLLALLQAAGLCKLLRLRSAAGAFTAAASPCTGSNQLAHGNAGNASNEAAGDDGCCSAVGAGAWGLLALQLFFCSGHFCEFSGLQYASAFIGFDDMVWYSSGSLLLVNTCGFLFLAPLSLPVIMACCAAPDCSGKVSIADEHKDEDVVQGSASHSNSWAGVLGPQIECGLWVMNSMRFAALAVSLVSAAVQQQHILLWAIFAPKLVFELWFMLVTAVGQLLVSGLYPTEV